MAIHPSPLGSITAFPSKLTLTLTSLVFFPLLSYHRLSTLSFPSFVRFPHLQRPSSFSSLPLFLHYSHLYLFCLLISNPIPSHLISSHLFCVLNTERFRLATSSEPTKQANAYRCDQTTTNQTVNHHRSHCLSYTIIQRRIRRSVFDFCCLPLHLSLFA
jgi:hypothetical protein